MKDSEKQYIHPTRIFKTEAELENAWEGYKDDLKEKAKEWPLINYVGKDGVRKVDNPKMPLTLEGFKRFCYDEEKGSVEQYFTNQDNYYGDFIGICSRIKNEIRESQITGGLLGVYNPSITQRLNGLIDKQEIKESVITIEGLPEDVESDLDNS